MSRDEVRKILGEGATEEQITNTLNVIHSSNAEIKKEKEEAERKISELQPKVDKLAEIEKANLTREEQIALREAEAEKNVKESRIIKNTAKAKEVLAGLDLEDDLIATLVSDDEAKTVANAQKLASKINNVKELTVLKTKEELATINLKPNLSNTNQNENAMTWEKFQSLSDDEKNKFQIEHSEEFNNL